MKELLYTFLLFLALSVLNEAQEHSSILFSKENTLKFADYLFSEEDYLRAIMEYNRYLNLEANDSFLLKIADGYFRMQRYDESNSYYQKLFNTSLHSGAVKGYALNEFLTGRFASLRQLKESDPGIIRLKFLSQLYPSEPLPDKDQINILFPEKSHHRLLDFYNSKAKPPYKSELTASLLSTLIPGSGKIYTRNYGDGITAFIVTSVLSYIAYDNFRAGHDTRAWIFTGIGGLFYAGNIYGSATAAAIHNAQLQIAYRQELDLFIKNNNYFLIDDY